MTFKDVKRELIQLENDKLVALLGELYKKNKDVKEYLDFLVAPNERKLYEKYEDKLYLAFFPARGHNYNLTTAKKAISDFKKAGATPELVAELTLYYLETGASYALEYGEIGENAYTSFEKSFVAMLEIMDKGGFLNKFHERIVTLINDTKDIGLGDVFYFPYQDLTEFDQTIYEDK